MFFLYFIIFFFAYVFVYQQRENILFRYPNSVWHKLDRKLNRPWFQLNSRSDWQKKIHPFFSFLWDGYHCFNWLCSFFVWAMVSAVMWPYVESWLKVFGMGLWMGIAAFILHQAYFAMLYRRK